MKRLIAGVPSALALSLLAFQLILPWTARFFMTMDGPAHLYNARVIGEVLFNPASPYHQFYRLRSALTTNWGTVLLFNLVSRLTLTYAEPLVASLSVLAAFSSFFYLLRSLDPKAPCTPVINFITLTWFLWVGFYNFYLAMALFALAAGYYIRNSARLSWRRATALSFLLLATFFTHILPAALAILTVLIVAVWLHCFAPQAQGIRKPGMLLPLLAAVIPACLLMGTFVLASHDGIRIRPDVVLAWRNFPSRVFAETYLVNASGSYLYPVMLSFLLLGILLLRRSEWSSARGGIAVATAVCFALYLVAPSHGFGGDDINARVAWGVFILGCTVASSGARMQMLAAPLALYVTGFLGVQLYHSMNRNVRNVSHAVEEYAQATSAISARSTVVRIHFNTMSVSREYGFRGLALDPVYHADAWMAARHGFVDLSDYQALSSVFALECRPPITEQERSDLWSLENGNADSVASLHRLLDDFPVPIDYVLVLGDAGSQKLELDQWGSLVDSRSFLRVFRRR
jgi:hypothetical protein